MNRLKQIPLYSFPSETTSINVEIGQNITKIKGFVHTQKACVWDKSAGLWSNLWYGILINVADGAEQSAVTKTDPCNYPTHGLHTKEQKDLSPASFHLRAAIRRVTWLKCPLGVFLFDPPCSFDSSSLLNCWRQHEWCKIFCRHVPQTQNWTHLTDTLFDWKISFSICIQSLHSQYKYVYPEPVKILHWSTRRVDKWRHTSERWSAHVVSAFFTLSGSNHPTWPTITETRAGRRVNQCSKGCLGQERVCVCVCERVSVCVSVSWGV